MIEKINDIGMDEAPMPKLRNVSVEKPVKSSAELLQNPDALLHHPELLPKKRNVNLLSIYKK